MSFYFYRQDAVTLSCSAMTTWCNVSSYIQRHSSKMIATPHPCGTQEPIKVDHAHRRFGVA